MPDLTLVLDVPPGGRPARGSGGPRDRIEDRPESYTRGVRAGFLRRRRARGMYPRPGRVVDASADPATVADRLRSEVARALALDPRA